MVRPADLPVWKLALFSIVAVVLAVVLVEAVLALGGVQPLLETEDPYVGFSGRAPLFVEGREGRHVTAGNRLRFFNAQGFDSAKPDGTFRIFCLGGSTTYGRPYDDTTSYCGWLRALLSRADPQRRWEVVNAGGISYASYRVVVIAEELAAYKPDLFVIYTGQNEFLEDRTYSDVTSATGPVARLRALLSPSRTYAFLTRRLKPAEPAFSENHGNLLPAEVATLLDRSLGPDEYERDDGHRVDVYRHFGLNLERMVRIARGAGGDVVLVTPASNLRDCSPFKSQPQVAESGPRLRQLGEATRRALATGDLSSALTATEEALAIDDRYADAHYLRGRVLDGLGRKVEARAAYRRAREEDVCPLRAPERTAEIVREVAGRLDVGLVDFDRLADSVSPDGVPGAGLFLDHVHPTIAGNRRLALEVLDVMTARGWLRPIDGWGPETVNDVARIVEAGLDTNAHGSALKNLAKVYAWAGKHAEAARLGQQAVQLAPDDAEAHYTLGLLLVQSGQLQQAASEFDQATRLRGGYWLAHYDLGRLLQSSGRPEAAEEHYRKALAAKPDYAEAHNNLGVLIEQRGDLDLALAEYRRAIELSPDLADARHNLGWLLGRRGDLDGAQQELLAALALRPDSPEFHHSLGLVFLRHGRNDQAASQFRQVLELLPGDEQARNALNQAISSSQ